MGVFKKILASAAALTIALGATLIARTNPDPWSAEEITRLTVGLNEAAAIGVPHGFLMSNVERAAHLALLEKVEVGAVLTPAESLEYRYIFQKTLQESQRFLGAFDGELTIIPDHAMDMANNVETKGIAGYHDHHDVSARANFAALLQSLLALDQAENAFARMRYANAAQKDLVDLISHMGVAPHTVSVPYLPPAKAWPDAELGAEFEGMMKAFKDAQFEAVNSTAYWAAIDVALENYAALILSVQAHVVAHTAPWERRVAGRFLSPQTLAPPVDLHRPLRRK
jgi:hypothetical protein